MWNFLCKKLPVKSYYMSKFITLFYCGKIIHNIVLIFSGFDYTCSFFSNAQNEVVHGEKFQFYSTFPYVQLQPYFVPIVLPTHVSIVFDCTTLHHFHFGKMFSGCVIALFPIMCLSPPTNIASQCKQLERYNRSVLWPWISEREWLWH